MNKENLPNTFLANAPAWWQPPKSELFNVYQNFRRIASCSYAIVDGQESPRGQDQYFPNLWYVYTSQRMKPILEITGLETISRKQKGIGRLLLQVLYNRSRLYGCEGRMQVLSSFGSAKFYEHCGFKGKNAGVDELKYFNPTDQNLTLLFSKQCEFESLKFIPVAAPRNRQDDALLFEMLSRSRQR